MREDIIQASVNRYHKMHAAEPTIEPEDGFIWVLEETDFGEHLTDGEYRMYLNAITKVCCPESIKFEQLPDNVLQRNYGDFSRCEGHWNPMTQDEADRFLMAAKGTCEAFGIDNPFEDIKAVQNAMRLQGVVVHLPIGYMRARNDYPKCPRCGSAIMEDCPALSRYDNKTILCSPCATKEAFEDFFKTVED